MNYPTHYGNSDSLALENQRLKSLVKDLKARSGDAEIKLEKVESMAKESISLAEQSLTRTFDGHPFPARLLARDVLDVLNGPV